MNPSDRDIQIASQLVESMAATTSFISFERHWQDFLSRLERSWEIALRAAKSRGGPKQQWISKNSALRRKDPLLRFLKHARDAETHALEATVLHDTFISVRDRLSRTFEVESLTASFESGVLTFDLKSPNTDIDWVGEVVPGDPKLKRFRTRNEWYSPPTEHLGQRIVDLHPVAVAILGLTFYRDQFANLYA